MKKLYFLMLLSAAFTNIHAQDFDWAKVEGLWAYDYGYGITTDHSGNVYVAGKYEKNAIFSGTVLPCEGNHDIYVAKYSPAGQLLWVTTAGGVQGDYATSIACDGNYLYVAGEIEGWGLTIKFQNSPVTLVSEGFNDIFLCKYDLNGNLIWAKRAGGEENEKALGATFDKSGNFFICGLFNDEATFDGTKILGSGKNDIYIAKYGPNGDFKWVRNAGSAGRDEAKGIVCDDAGNAYIVGMHSDGCAFGSTVLASPNGYFNAFIAKYTGNGDLEWVKTLGDNYDDVAWAITTDNAGKIYITGEFVGYVPFGNGIDPLVSVGLTDVFVACYNASGDPLWARQAGGDLVDRARGIGCDGNYNVYITGQFGSTASFGSHSVNAADSSDIFNAAISTGGNFMWANSVGGGVDSLEDLGYECGNTICSDTDGNVYSTGSLLNGGIFGSTELEDYSRTDIFIAKITQAGVNVQENPGSNQFMAFPNPSNGIFTVSIPGGHSAEADISVFNMLGEKVYRKSVPAGLSRIDLSGSTRGIYFIEINSGEERKTKKMIIE